MGKLLGGLVGVVGALWLGIAGVVGAEGWEHRAAGQPAFLNLRLLWWRWSPPPSLAAQRDAARRQLGAAQADEARLAGALAAQDAAVRAQAAAGARALAGAEADVARYRLVAGTAARRVRIIGAPLAGDEVCARVKEADAKLLETLE